MNGPSIFLILALLREIREHVRDRAFTVAGMMLLVAALEGSGLLILAPLLSLAGVAAQPQAGPEGPLNALFDSTGLPQSLSGVLLGYLALIVLHAFTSWRRSIAFMQLQDFVDRLHPQLHRHIGTGLAQRLHGRKEARLVGGAIALTLLSYVALVHMQVPPASVLVLAFIFSRLLPFLSTLQQSYERLFYNLPVYASLDTMRRRCVAAEPAGAPKPPPFARELRLEQPHYRPPGSGYLARIGEVAAVAGGRHDA